jgi:hypothetical protein
LPPLLVFLEMMGIDIFCRSGRFHRSVKEVHPGFFNPSATFPVIALRAGGHNIQPGVRTSKMARDHMVDSKVAYLPSTILAGVPITP